MSFKEGYLVEIDTLSIFYRIEGAGDDTVLVVHGGPGAGMENIRPDLQPLTTPYTLIFYDQRGGGQSELPGGDGRETGGFILRRPAAISM